MSNLREFIQATKQNNGATFNLNTGELNPGSGYFIGLKGGSVSKNRKDNSDLIQQFVLKNSFQLSDKDNFLGSWVEDGEIYLDVVVRVTELKEAIKIGLKNEQIAIYDASKKEVITLNVMLSNEDIADKMLSDMQAYKENIRDIIIGRLMDSSCQRTYWDAWFRGAEGKDLEDADKGIIYKK